MKRFRATRAACIGLALIALTTVLSYVAIVGLPSPPSPPPPPDWASRAAIEFVAKIAPTLYWEMAVVLLAVYEVLRWQRAVQESPAARWYRRFQLSKAFVWLTLAVGRTLFQEWLMIGWALIVLYVAFMLNMTALALIRTYAIPIWKCRNGRCIREQPPLIDGGLLPRAWNVERDGERRSGKERRRNWRPQS